MDWTTPPADQPIWSPAGETPAGLGAASPIGTTPDPSRSTWSHPALGGLRRTIATALLAVGLLVVGGVAVVNAADPVGSAAPGATTQPSTGSGQGTAPGAGSPQAPNGGGPNRQAPNGAAPGGRTGHDCPNMGGSAGNQGSGGRTGPSSPAAPSTTDTPSSSNL
jgi:hypothetical protein